MTNNIADEVMEAFYENFDGFCDPMYNECVATTLRKVADILQYGGYFPNEARAQLIDIADELEAQTYD